MAQYRYLAKNRLEKAEKLLASPDNDDLIYACLELRKCIEALSYELLKGYLPEVPLKAIDVWQPDKVMRELLRIDSGADRTARLRMKREGRDGEPDGPWIELGEDRRMKTQWASKSYQRLGSYLHVPTIKQDREGASLDFEEVRKRVGTIRDVLQHILSATIWNANFAVSVAFSCSNCEAPIKRRSEILEKGEPIECGNCGQLYDAEDHSNGNYFFVPHAVSWNCEACGEPRSIMQSLVKVGADVSCPKCKDRATLAREERWFVERQSESTEE